MSGEKLINFLETQGVNLLCGLLVLAAGLFLVRWILRFMERSDKYVRLEPTLKGFLTNLIRLVLYIIVVLTAANVIGIPMTSIVTLVASAGVAVSLAMQGALGNLVGGFTLLLLKPIKAGEFVKIGEYEGTVRTIGAFYTDLITFDNRHINLPNSTLTNTAIINYSREGTRRLDVTFSVGYDSDLDLVYKTLNALVASESRVLPEPAAQVVLNKLSDSSLDFSIRVWTNNADYWPVYFYLLDGGKRALDQAGIEIPYPQMDVHVKQEVKA
ncbi:MAG: mechanosensitive ion channel [Clostridia bacterium]|nr:mechanosensitive ion channel [Clostridia bacterium]